MSFCLLYLPLTQLPRTAVLYQLSHYQEFPWPSFGTKLLQGESNVLFVDMQISFACSSYLGNMMGI